MELGLKIQRLRQCAGLSQRELADRLGIATGTLQQYELGKREPKLEMINKIATELGVTVAQLIDESLKIEDGEYTSTTSTDFYCQICDWNFDPKNENAVREHFEHHKKYLNAVKIFGKLIKMKEAYRLRKKSIEEMNNPNNSNTKIYQAAKTYLRSEFSLSVIHSGFDINHIDFISYARMQLDKQWATDILPEDVYFKLLYEFEKEHLNDTEYYPRRYNELSLDDEEEKQLKMYLIQRYPRLNLEGKQKLIDYLILLSSTPAYMTAEEKECQKVQRLRQNPSFD